LKATLFLGDRSLYQAKNSLAIQVYVFPANVEQLTKMIWPLRFDQGVALELAICHCVYEKLPCVHLEGQV
jgi:hypothetical protein